MPVRSNLGVARVVEDGKDIGIARYQQSFSIRAFTECYHTRFIVRLLYLHVAICDRYTRDYTDTGLETRYDA